MPRMAFSHLGHSRQTLLACGRTCLILILLSPPHPLSNILLHSLAGLRCTMWQRIALNSQNLPSPAFQVPGDKGMSHYNPQLFC